MPEYRQNTSYDEIASGWDESKHPGDEDGKFTNGSGDSSKADDGKAKKSVKLTKQDWARIYHKLGEIKQGGAVGKVDGDMIIPLTKMSDTDTPKIVIVAGTYENPKMKLAIPFNSEEEMFDMLEKLKWH